jgi:hypothetical protein
MTGRTFAGGVTLAPGMMLGATPESPVSAADRRARPWGTPAWFLQASFPDPTGRTIVEPGGRVIVPPRRGMLSSAHMAPPR